MERPTGRSLTRKESMVMEMRQRIILEALRLFSLKGFLSTSVQDILTAAGASKGGLYNHFKSKEDLFFAVLDEARRIWRENNLAGFDQIDKPVEKVKKLLNNFKDVSAFNGGHLQFNAKLANPSIVSNIALGSPFSPSVNVAPASLNTSTFTHLSITLPSDMNGTIKRLVTIGVTYTSGSTSVQPLIILNDVKWTTD